MKQWGYPWDTICNSEESEVAEVTRVRSALYSQIIEGIILLLVQLDIHYDLTVGKVAMFPFPAI